MDVFSKVFYLNPEPPWLWPQGHSTLLSPRLHSTNMKLFMPGSYWPWVDKIAYIQQSVSWRNIYSILWEMDIRNRVTAQPRDKSHPRITQSLKSHFSSGLSVAHPVLLCSTLQKSFFFDSFPATLPLFHGLYHLGFVIPWVACFCSLSEEAPHRAAVGTQSVLSCVQIQITMTSEIWLQI